MSMEERKGWTRRAFLQKGGMAAAAGAAGILGGREVASAQSGTYATIIDLTRCDGCKNELMPKCVAARPCANLCPLGALHQNADSSVVINPDLCLGGAKCKTVCPWNIPQRQSGVGIYLKLHPIPAGGGVMYKCDLCHDRLEKKLIPACVEACAQRLGGRRPLFFCPRGAEGE